MRDGQLTGKLKPSAKKTPVRPSNPGPVTHFRRGLCPVPGMPGTVWGLLLGLLRLVSCPRGETDFCSFRAGVYQPPRNPLPRPPPPPPPP